MENMHFLVSEIDVCQILLRIPRPSSIVTLYGIYETFDKIYIVMDYIASGNLEELIQNKFCSLSLKNKYFIASQITKGVAFLHKNNIMHRDIKADNILIDKNYHIYLIYFGLSYIIGDNEYTKGSYGTMSYAPPEMYSHKQYNTAIDIWSMGVLLYYLFYGEMPFSKEEKKVEEVVKNIMKKQLSFYQIEDLNEDEQQMQKRIIEGIKKCLNREVEKRPKANEIANIFIE